MGKSKTSIFKSITSIRAQIDLHSEKIELAMETGTNEVCIPHWEKEIQVLRAALQKELKRLKPKKKR